MSKKTREQRPPRAASDDSSETPPVDETESELEPVSEEPPEADRLAIDAADSERASNEAAGAPTLAGPVDLLNANAPANPEPPPATAPLRPTLDDLKAAVALGMSVEVAIIPPLERGKIAGLCVDRTPRVHALSVVVACGPSYVRALAVDERIRVRIVESKG